MYFNIKYNGKYYNSYRTKPYHLNFFPYIYVSCIFFFQIIRFLGGTLSSKIKLLKNQGILGKSDGGNVKHTSIGFNFKYTNIQAAMGLAQISSIRNRVKKLKEINSLGKKNVQK